MNQDKDQDKCKGTPLKPEKSNKKLEGESAAQLKDRWTTFKKKRVPSMQSKMISMMNRKGSQDFELYRDNDIGIAKKYQVIVHDTNNDDDYETDEEQLRESIRYCVYQTKQAIDKEFMDQSNIYEDFSETYESDIDEGQRTLKKGG